MQRELWFFGIWPDLGSLMIGAFVIACLNNGLVLLGAQATESNIYLGAAIIAAMILNVQVDAVRVRRKR